MDAEAIAEVFASLGPVTVRRMFGGQGIYHSGRILAVVFRGDLLLKADEVSAPLFAAAGAVRWSHEGRSGKPVDMPYWSIPSEAYDDPDLMAHWVRLAAEAAARAEPKGRGRRPSGKRASAMAEEEPWPGDEDGSRA